MTDFFTWLDTIPIKEIFLILSGLLVCFGFATVFNAKRKKDVDYYRETPDFDHDLLRKLALAKGALVEPPPSDSEIIEAKDWFKTIQEDNPDKVNQYNSAWNLHNEIATNLKNDRWLNYEHLLDRSLDWLCTRLFKEPSNPHHQTSLKRFFTTESYEFCLALALFYPILFALLNLPISLELQIGQLVIFPPMSAMEAWLTLFSIIVVVYCFIRLIRTDEWQSLIWLGASVAGAAVAVAVAGAGAGAFAGAGAGAVAVAVVGAGAVAGAGAGAGAVFYITYRTITKIVSNDWLKHLASSLFLLAYSLVCILIVLLFGDKKFLELIFLPLILAVLPILNAPIDWLSLNITRWLISKMQQHHHNAWLMIFYGVLDLALAFAFVFLLTAIILLVMLATNHLTMAVSGQLLLDFSVLMKGLTESPREYIWLHLMVLSTLFPTLLHFILVLYSFASWPVAHWGKAAYNRLYHRTSEQHGCFREDRSTIMYASNFRKLLTGLFLGLIAFLLYYLHGGIYTIAGSLWHWADWILGLDPAYQSPVLATPAD